MIVFILFVGLFAISTTNACGQCDTKHPQQHFCDADFAMKLTIVGISKESDVANTNIITATILSTWKRGPKEGEFEFYNPTSFCGTYFVVDHTYVVTGMRIKQSSGRNYWSHGSCDFDEEWGDMSAEQKKGFREEYAEMCDQCQIQSTRVASDIRVADLDNNYSLAATYWTPTNCYYNPHKTQEVKSQADVVDCEDVYGICSRNREGQCNWRMTDVYEECFKVRDEHVMAKTRDFAFTDISQCKLLPTRRKRKKCRKQFSILDNTLQRI